MTPLSPLRYPGGKAKFSDLVRRTIRSHTKAPPIFAEPFCGGAGVALTLLSSGDVSRLALNDIDPLVAAFWQVVFGRTGKSNSSSKADVTWLLSKVESVKVTLDEWRIQKCSVPASSRAAAFKCLFLNRTSFNGILHKSGPIGGWGQLNRTLDVRFNRESLCERIRWLWDRRDAIDLVACEPWESFIQRYTRQNSFLYLDPPYYHRAEQLYGYLFDEAAHRRLRDALVNTKETPWLLSYDDSIEVRGLYQGLAEVDGLVIDKTYSAHPLGGGRFVGRELFFSNKTFNFASRAEDVEHSAISVVGSIESVGVSTDGPVRLPIQGDIAQRRKSRNAYLASLNTAD